MKKLLLVFAVFSAIAQCGKNKKQIINLKPKLVWKKSNETKIKDNDTNNKYSDYNPTPLELTTINKILIIFKNASTIQKNISKASGEKYKHWYGSLYTIEEVIYDDLVLIIS